MVDAEKDTEEAKEEESKDHLLANHKSGSSNQSGTCGLFSPLITFNKGNTFPSRYRVISNGDYEFKHPLQIIIMI